MRTARFPPDKLVAEILRAMTRYSRSGVGAAEGVDRMPVAIHGWSYAQTDPEPKATVEAGLRAFRDQCVPLVKQWQAEGTVADGVEPDELAQLIQSICLGFMVPRTMGGGASVESHANALAALMRADGDAPVGPHDDTERILP